MLGPQLHFSFPNTGYILSSEEPGKTNPSCCLTNKWPSNNMGRLCNHVCGGSVLYSCLTTCYLDFTKFGNSWWVWSVGKSRPIRSTKQNHCTDKVWCFNHRDPLYNLKNYGLHPPLTQPRKHSQIRKWRPLHNRHIIWTKFEYKITWAYSGIKVVWATPRNPLYPDLILNTINQRQLISSVIWVTHYFRKREFPLKLWNFLKT